jgi:hypothetical protein
MVKYLVHHPTNTTMLLVLLALVTAWFDRLTCSKEPGSLLKVLDKGGVGGLSII